MCCLWRSDTQQGWWRRGGWHTQTVPPLEPKPNRKHLNYVMLIKHCRRGSCGITFPTATHLRPRLTQPEWNWKWFSWPRHRCRLSFMCKYEEASLPMAARRRSHLCEPWCNKLQQEKNLSCKSFLFFFSLNNKIESGHILLLALSDETLYTAREQSASGLLKGHRTTAPWEGCVCR